MIALECEAALVEATVLAALAGGPAERPFHAERDPLYAIADVDERDAAFAALHARWFDRLGLEGALRQALAERPEIEAGCARGIVAHAPAARAEVADLLVSPRRGSGKCTTTVSVELRPRKTRSRVGGNGSTPANGSR